MSRSGYDPDFGSDEPWDFIRWRGAVSSAFKGARGQAFLKEMLKAMDALPFPLLIKKDLVKRGRFRPSYCAIGAVGAKRGIDMSELDPEDPETVSGVFGIAPAMAREIVWENDEASCRETPEQRFIRMRAWVKSWIKK